MASKKPYLIKSREPKPTNQALAPKKPRLTKGRKPKPPNSACAEFGTQIAGFKGGKTFQGENRQTIPRIRLSPNS
ncbi:MAG: hypothetical protein IAA81_09095 [Spirochaetes bacterium]|uniref:Uncharacterized protein n=1 Tax=Candidatus Gallitreponema excrementavium TaxID=2840840 RepID=A0A9D9HQG9_9SPIR|nr:hypothetical protein [Candidatus Gallitreponema excrementavium]